MSFQDFPLHDRLQRAITSAGYLVPTPIQTAAIPLGLAGSDLVGTAQTGTGKTAAFVLPLLQRLLTTPATPKRTRVLILTPTRELAEQIHASIQQLATFTNIRSATVYGGVGMMPQQRALRNGTEIIVACPGRLLDHVDRGNADLSQVECLVLDEADRMLDMGFLPPITRIVGLVPVQRQTMLFSATFAPELNSFVDKHLREPARLDIDLHAPASTVEHALYPVHALQKTALLKTLLRTLDTRSVLIFTRTKHRANHVAEHLNRAGFAVGVLHSNRSQNQRQLVLDGFRRGDFPCLVATDIAARGIDVTSISHVINYDIPDTADAYIHRIGRTGRAEQTGEALTLVTLDDARTIRDIERELQEPIEKRYLPEFEYTAEAAAPAKTGRTAAAERPRPPRRTEPSQLSAPRKERKPTGIAAVSAPAPAPARKPLRDKSARPQRKPLAAKGNTAAPSRNGTPRRASAAPGRRSR